MATLRFEIDTDSSFDADELGELQEQFSDWISELDGGAEVDTVDARIVNNSNGDSVKDRAIELLKNSNVTVSVNFSDENGDEIFESTYGM